MNVIHRATDLATSPAGACVAIGMFDGVHLGHQRILTQTIRDAAGVGARSVAITFDRHPHTVLAPERAPALIHSLPQKLEVIEALGIQTTWLIHFDEAFSRQPAQAFIEDLVRNSAPLRSICIGRGFTFGHRRTGNVALLQKLGPHLGFLVHDLPALTWKGKAISSTRIREAVNQGQLADASALLGRPYSIRAKVVPGEKLGHQLGFPTANLDTTGLQLPPAGVYAGLGRLKSATWPAVANLGYRPTIASGTPALRFEVHLLDFGGDIYGEELEFEFKEHLRPEVRFGSVQELKQQIRKDIEAARSLLQQPA